MRVSIALALLLSSSCFYSVNPNVGLFTCSTNADCGSNWHCNSTCSIPGFNPYCVENGYCDPCPDTSSDPQNCGGCGIACAPMQTCINAVCIVFAPEDAG